MKLLNGAMVTVAGTALLCGVAATGGAAPAEDGGSPHAAIACQEEVGDNPFYQGDSASKVYDARFSQGGKVPYVEEGYTPQGMAHWGNWDGNGNDLLLITAYKDGEYSRIYGVDADSGKHVGSVDIAEAHVGGVAVVQKDADTGWAFVSGTGSDRIRKYGLGELRKQMRAPGIPDVAQVGDSRKVYSASFIGTDGTQLYAGKFNDGGRDKMYSYSVANDGSLNTGKEYEVPTKTQGMAVAGGKFIYSTSYGRGNRSNLYVVDGGATDIDPSAKCFRAPSMSQGVTTNDGTLYLLFESGSSKFDDPPPRNDIKHVHEASVADVIDF